MMRLGYHQFCLIAVLATVPATAAPKASSESQRLIQSCDAHKFETIVDSTVGGQPHQSKVKLCGVEGQSDAEWINTLRDAITKVEANKDMPAAQRLQIVTAIKAEIARLSILAAGPGVPRRSGAVVSNPIEPRSRDYSTLPPLPPPPEAQPALQADSARSAAAPGNVAVPALAVPTPLSPPTPSRPSIPATAALSYSAAAAPRLRFGCDTPGDLSSDATCAEFERDTIITVHAAEDVPAGTSLQFVRNDRPQADIPLGGLRRGAALRVALPPKVCAGFTSGKLELKIVNASGSEMSQGTGSEGPYSLRC